MCDGSRRRLDPARRVRYVSRMVDAHGGAERSAADARAGATRSLPVRWQWSAFASLQPLELHAALMLRAAVFVVEQRCAFLDPDAFDVDAWHLLGWSTHAACASELVACARVLPPGKYSEPSIGRLVTATNHRGLGLGRAAMMEGMRHARARFPGCNIRIGAQRYLERFYASLGFVPSSPPYDEDGIPHIEMVWEAHAPLP